MLWKRATPAGGFWGLLAGILTSLILWLWVKLNPAALIYVAFSMEAKDMSENVFRAAWSLLACVVVTVAVSLVTRPRPEAELEGLVYGLTKIPSQQDLPVLKRPIFWAGAVALLFVILNVAFW
jgi:SSS family solute:Na+ symporter